jgi:hypothetical protein
MLEQPSHEVVLGQLRLEPAQREAITQILTAHEAIKPEWTCATVEALAVVRRTVLNPEQARQLDALLAPAPRALAPRVIVWARDHRLLPEAYLFGFLHVWKLSQARTAFFNGEVRHDGWRTFFPFAFLVKTPLALFGVALLAAAAVWRHSDRAVWWRATLPLWALTAVYWIAAIFSHLNIGHRHLLPIYPPLFILCGCAMAWLVPAARRGPAWLLAGLVAAHLLETFTRFPHYLAYFNGLIHPTRAYLSLIDSSLDWGQDLPGLARYIREKKPAEPLHLAFFGIGQPEFHGIAAKKIYGFPGYDRGRSPPLMLLVGAAPAESDPAVVKFRQEHPVYDPALLFGTNVGDAPAAVLLKRAEALRLGGGTCFVSATLLQPVMLPLAHGSWSPAHEATYQRLRATVAPLLSDDPATRGQGMAAINAFEWLTILDHYDQFRFARLTAFLRQRAPDDNINYTILVYRLSDADIARFVDGPPP